MGVHKRIRKLFMDGSEFSHSARWEGFGQVKRKPDKEVQLSAHRLFGYPVANCEEPYISGREIHSSSGNHRELMQVTKLARFLFGQSCSHSPYSLLQVLFQKILYFLGSDIKKVSCQLNPEGVFYSSNIFPLSEKLAFQKAFPFHYRFMNNLEAIRI